MKRNGRHRNGTHAKRRRARIARRLVYVRQKAADFCTLSWFMGRSYADADFKIRSYSFLNRRFEVAVFYRAPKWAEPISVTIWFAEPEQAPEIGAFLRTPAHAEGTLEPGDFEKFDAWARVTGDDPKIGEDIATLPDGTFPVITGNERLREALRRRLEDRDFSPENGKLIADLYREMEKCETCGSRENLGFLHVIGFRNKFVCRACADIIQKEAGL